MLLIFYKASDVMFVYQSDFSYSGKVFVFFVEIGASMKSSGARIKVAINNIVDMFLY